MIAMFGLTEEQLAEMDDANRRADNLLLRLQSGEQLERRQPRSDLLYRTTVNPVEPDESQ